MADRVWCSGGTPAAGEAGVESHSSGSVSNLSIPVMERHPPQVVLLSVLSQPSRQCYFHTFSSEVLNGGIMSAVKRDVQFGQEWPEHLTFRTSARPTSHVSTCCPAAPQAGAG